MFPIEFVHRAAAYRPDAVAVDDEGVTRSYAQILEEARALGAAFQALAGKRRVKVALLCPNSIDLFIGILAIHASGAILIPLNPRNARAELEAQIELVTPDVLIVDHTCADKIAAWDGTFVMAGVDRDPTTLTVRALIAEFRGRQPVWPDVTLADEYAVKFTGGSSGRPKGVLQSFRSHNTVIVHVVTGLAFTDGEVYVCAAPMTHGAGSFILPTLAVGGKVVIEHSTEPAHLLNALEASAATAIWVPPTLLNMMIHEQRTAPRPLKHLRHIIFGGAPTAPERIEEGRKVFGDVLETTYGQTEASTIATALRASEMADERVRYSAGRACLLSRVAVMAPDGALLPPGESGEIVVSGDLVMNGYIAMPEESAKTLVDGWLHTGDVGYLDERGYLFVRDRIRDVVISGGFNVYPSDVEAALGKHPAVHEAVVFGVPDSHWGERVEAAVELRPGMTAAENELIAFMKELIGSVKTPKRVHIVELLPRSPVGKVLRREAKAMFSGT